MSKTHLLIIALLWANSNTYVFSQNYGYRFIDDKQVSEVQMKLINNLPIVEVTINKQKKLNFILDTGMRSTLVFSKSYLKGLDLNLGREIEFAGVGSDRLIKGRIVSNVTLNIGDIEGDGLSFLVIGENQGIKQRFKHLNVHGIIGYGLFARFVVEIDYHNKIVSFCDHEYFDFDDVYEQIPMQLLDTKPHIFASYSLNGNNRDSVRLMLDTGLSATMLLSDDYSPDDYITNNTTVAAGLSGKINGSVANLREIKIKSFKLKNVPVLIVASSGVTKNNRVHERVGSLGSGMFLAYSIVFDYARERFFMKRQHPSANRVIVSL